MAPDFLNELLLLLAVATLGVALFERLRLPPIAGFLVMGALMGPGGFGLIGDPERVRDLAELGVVFLLFEIGLELPMERLRRMWRQSVLAGGFQVGLTLAFVAGVATLLGLDFRVAVVIGALVAMSSTALVMRLLAERGEIDAPQGQLAIGILIFQDLCIVPFLLAVPILAGVAGSSGSHVALAIGRAIVALVVLLVVSRFLLPVLLERVARLRSRELFTMVSLLSVMGSAVIAEKIGLTLSVGAFVGGLVLAATPYAHQLFAEVLPLRGLLLGIFFTAVGMLFDWELAREEWAAIAAYTASVVLVKAGFVVFLVAIVLRQGTRLGILTGLALAQTGEFSFVLAAAADDAGLLDDRLRQVFIAGSIATLLLTPFLIDASPKIASWLASDRSPAGTKGETVTAPAAGHIVVIGFGLAGQNIARVLKARGTPYVVIDANAVGVRTSQARGEPILYGDATRRSLLERAEVARASMVVIAVSDPIATREITALTRSIAPNAPILARTRYVAEVDTLEQSGATKVVVEELEATLELVARMLATFNVPQESIIRFTTELRDEGYVFLRSPDEILDPWLIEQLESVATEWVEVPASYRGEASLLELNVRAHTGATIVAVQRPGSTSTGDPEHVIRAGDRLLAIGGPDAIEALHELFSEASHGDS